ncbi:MAG: hemin uptake protein HemP [Oceanospirillaceae bacterium]
MSIPSTSDFTAEQIISTEKLMQGKKELIIFHSEQRYILRITRNGKLILTK